MRWSRLFGQLDDGARSSVSAKRSEAKVTLRVMRDKSEGAVNSRNKNQKLLMRRTEKSTEDCEQTRRFGANPADITLENARVTRIAVDR